MKETLKEIQEYIAKDEIAFALKKLRCVFNLADSEMVTEVVLLSGQYQKIQSDIRKGIITYETEVMHCNRIRNSVLSLIEELMNQPKILTDFCEVEMHLADSYKMKVGEEIPFVLKDILIKRLANLKEKHVEISALWIDDNQDFNEHERNVLQSAGLKFDCVDSSEKAYKILQENQYDLIISDIERGNNKTEGLKFNFRLIAEGKDFPTIFYVGKVEKDKGTPPYTFGMADTPDELMHLVMDIIDRKI